MTITDADRHRLYDALVATLGEQEATILMEHLPPVGWADVATKTDLDHLRAATKTDLEHLRAATKADIDGHRAETRAEFEQLRLTTKADIEHLRIATKADIDGLRAATKADINGLRGDFNGLRGEFNGLRAEFEHLRTETNSGFRELHAVIDARTDLLRSEIAATAATLHTTMAEKSTSQLRWIIATMLASYAVIAAMAGLWR